METQSTSAISCPLLESSYASQEDASAIRHLLVRSEDFEHISVEANAAADDVMKTVQAASAAASGAKQKRKSTTSIGILDLEEEGASFQVEPDSVQDFMKMALDSLTDTETFRVTSPASRQTCPTPSSLHFFNLSSPPGNKDSATLGSPSSTPGSLDVTNMTLELQAALRVAELEVSQLHAQVSSKTQHLEMAQRALVEYEDEVSGLRAQLKSFTEFPYETASPSSSMHERQISHESIARELWKVHSGTHRIRQSLGDGDEAVSEKEYQVLKENFEQLNERHKQLGIKNEGMRVELDGVTAELQGALKKIQEHKERREKLMEENGILMKEKTKLKTQLLRAQEELMCVLAETPDADEEVSTYRQRLKEAQDQREKLHRDLDCAKAELAALKSEWLSAQKNKEVPFAEASYMEQVNEERVLQLREVLNSKLREHPEMLTPEDDASDGSDRENDREAKERIHQLQEALSLALEAKSLLEEKVASKAEISSDGLQVILDDISELKANFQRERRMALRERTENENLIMNLQHEKDTLLHQMQDVTAGLNALQQETVRVQGELANKRLSAEEFKIKAEERIRELELSNIAHQKRLAQVREALDLCLEAKRELEIRVQQSNVVLSEWVRSFGRARMQEEENFTSLLRHRVETGNAVHVKQAALQAIEHLERLQEETQKRVNWSSSSVDFPADSMSDTDVSSQSEARMMSVTSHQLRGMRRDLREVTAQRDEAWRLLKEQKATDARRFREIQELQQDLNAALEQNETLLPQFHEVINSKKEMENKAQHLMHELHQQDKRRMELEAAVWDLLAVCHKVLKGAGSTPRKSQSLTESIQWAKEDLEDFYQILPKKKGNSHKQQKPMRRVEKTPSTGSSTSTVLQHRNEDLRPLMEQLRSMVDKERDLRRYFDSQTEKLSKMRVDTEQRSHWVRRQSMSPSISDGDYPATEMQIQERSHALKKLSQKGEEITELLAELSQVQSMDQEVQMLLSGLDSTSQQSEDILHPMTGALGDRLNRLQDCAGSLERELVAVKTENKQLKAERQFLLQSLQSRS